MAQWLRVLLFPRTRVQFPSTIWQFTIVCNSSFRVSDTFTQSSMEAEHNVYKMEQQNKTVKVYSHVLKFQNSSIWAVSWHKPLSRE